jgi:hypothetical protein
MEGATTHIVPLNDLRGHIESPDCWCKPIDTDPGVWSHNSLDGREEFERGERRPS